MTVYAAIDFATALPVVIGLCGLGGLVFTALRFRRDDTSSIVSTQDTIFNELKTLNDELRQENERLRALVQELKHELD